jgi:Cytochrome bd terminal oxidase subunit I
VGRGLHFTGTLAVAVGTFISAFWILAANSWMQTPVGYATNPGGQFVPADWLAIIFSPSFPYRLVHAVFAAYLTTALVVGAVGAWHLLRERGNEGARVMFSMAMGMISVVAPLQILAGDQHGAEHARAPAGQGHGHGSHDPAGRRANRESALHAAGRADHGAHHPRLHRLFVLGVPRQDRARGLPLMPAPRQWLWFVGLWAAGVGVTALVGYAIKFWLKQ